VEIRRFIGARASEDELRRCHELYAESIRLTFPGFPPQPFAGYAAALRGGHLAGVGPRHAWAAREGDRLIGLGLVVYPEQHTPDWAMPRVFVEQSRRRRGIGTALLRELVADARAQGRSTLGSDQVRLGTAAEQWAVAAGFVNTLSNCWQMLHVADVDQALWDVPVPAGFRLERWAGAAPESLVSAFAAARNAIADAPHGESTFRAPEWTVERVRQAEADLRRAGDDSRFVVAVHEETGAVAALTGMVLRPGRVDLCWQRDTAVVAQFRGSGLGRVVKAEMMRRLVAEFPDLGRIVTNTAAGNASMIRVNQQIGYTHYADIGMFEASVEQIGAALGMSSNTNIPGPRREPAREPAGA
jgi:mycothiol synthase